MRQAGRLPTGASKKTKRKRTAWSWVWRMMLILFCVGLVSYAGLVGYVYYAETHVPAFSDYDSIIVLGAQVLATGEPSIQLRLRLDKALELYRGNAENPGNPCPVVVCGAQGWDEPAPEGEVMKTLLVLDGMPEADIYPETTSEDSKENIRNAWEILRGLGCERPLIVTSDYHLPRALAIAEDMGLHAQGAGSLCKNELGFWLKNHMREALAWVKYWGIKHLGLPL